MNRLSDLDDLLRYLKELCQRGSTGTVAFIPTNGTWGKIVLSQGEIISLRFQTWSGNEALRRLPEVGQLQYSFRMEEPGARADRPTNIDSATFFGFFRMLAPVVPALAAAPTASPAAPPPGKPTLQRRKKVLLVDADRISRRSVARLLSEAGYDSLEVATGFDALGQLATERPDLMLLDPMLPDIKGDKMLDSVTRMVTWPMPLFILWRRDGPIDDFGGRLTKGAAFFIKPVDGRELLEKVAGHLNPGAAAQGAPAAAVKPEAPPRMPPAQPARASVPPRPAPAPAAIAPKAPEIRVAERPVEPSPIGAQFKIPNPDEILSLVENHLTLMVGPIGPMIAANYRDAAQTIQTDEQLLSFVEQVRTEIPDERQSLEFRRALLEEFW